MHATRTTTLQAIGWATAALASVVALVLVAFARVPRRPWRALRNAGQAFVRSIRVVDGVVGVSLLSWWVLSPAFYDDGWTIARQRGFETTRGFSSYYNGLGTNLPNDYWLDWLQHWFTQSFETLLTLRIPALLCLAVIWALSRWTLSRVVPTGTSTRGLPEWVLASAFLAGAMAWGMTLRPEPIIAVLVAASMACAVWFSQGRGAAPVAVFAVLVPLAATGHHAGVVLLAPLLVISGPILRWAREELATAVAIVTSAFALLVTLAFVGSDIAQRANDAQATRLYGGVTDTWRDEASRYDYLSFGVAANPLRRGWVALVVLAVLAFLLRRRRVRTSLDLAPGSLGVALVLLIATPSKWPWHFGALVGIAAVAVASETIRLRRDAADARRWSARPFRRSRRSGVGSRMGRRATRTVESRGSEVARLDTVEIVASGGDRCRGSRVFVRWGDSRSAPQSTAALRRALGACNESGAPSYRAPDRVNDWDTRARRSQDQWLDVDASEPPDAGRRSWLWLW